MNKSNRDMVSAQRLDKFKHLYFIKFNIKLSDKEAMDQAVMFLTLMKVLIKPQAYNR